MRFQTLAVRTLTCLLFLAVGMAVRPALAEDVHLGVVVSSLGGTLTVADEEGKQQMSFSVDADTVITLNMKPAKLEDLTQGDLVKVTTETVDGKVKVKSIDGKSSKVKQPDGRSTRR